MASLEHILINIKSREREIFFVWSIILVGLIGFGLGRLSRLDDNKMPITIRESASAVNSEVSGVISVPVASLTANVNNANKIVASKTGTTYNFTWCSGAKRINEANKVWFASQAEAERAGYKKAVNCKGLSSPTFND